MALSGNAGPLSSFLASLGFTPAGTAGTLGAWQAESGLNPNARNPSSGATGIAQWLGSRLTALEATASRMGQPATSLTAQEAYFRQEITSPQYSGLLHELQTTTNPQQAARDFVNVFERPGPGGDASAASNAQAFFGGNLPGPSGSVSTTSGGGTENTGGGGLPPWVGMFTPFGPLITGDHPIIPGTEGVAAALGGIVSDLASIANAFLSLFRPSFWLRVGAFLFGIILLIGGFVTLKGAAL